ncbi:MAG: hypothetical protein CME04_09475 [Gemmatimonadaceae bacterium]|nr:hypothetical protein [Gemmatimonadaceae bacterium]
MAGLEVLGYAGALPALAVEELDSRAAFVVDQPDDTVRRLAETRTSEALETVGAVEQVPRCLAPVIPAVQTYDAVTVLKGHPDSALPILHDVGYGKLAYAARRAATHKVNIDLLSGAGAA